MNSQAILATGDHIATDTFFNLLVVEDSEAERYRLSALLRKLNYQVQEACDGVEAMQKLQNQTFDLIISDWRMPRMDGLTLCKKVQSSLKDNPYFILLTGQDAMCDLVAAMDAGADDFISKPFDHEELRVRLKAGLRMMAMRDTLKQQNAEVIESLIRESDLNRKIQQDLKAAEKLQRELLPPFGAIYPGLKLAHYFQAASGVAGDMFNILPLGNKIVAFYHIDVAGHGIRSAMHSFNISRLLTDPNTSASLCWTVDGHGKAIPETPSKVVNKLNARFQKEIDCVDYFTMIYGVIDLSSGKGRFCQAGHPHPLRVPVSGDPAVLGDGGFPIGFFPEADYHEHAFQLNHRDRLVITSDGIFSCKLSSGKNVDNLILMNLLNKLKTVSIESVQTRLTGIFDKLIAASPLEDDVSIMIIERA